LEEYINQSPTPAKKRDVRQSEKNSNLLSGWLRWDLDIYIGAAGASAALLIISCLAFANGGLGSSKHSTSLRFRRSQFFASILVFSGCLINIWLVRRRRFSTSQGSDGLKRPIISRFLKKIEKQEEECVDTQTEDNVVQESGLNLAGTSLTDIYPVYRQSQRCDGEISGGSWNRIPTLLLVRGDHISLQVGDITPAACRVVEGPNSEITIEAGKRITLETYEENSSSAMGKLPRGRTTLPKDSDELLALCNNLRIFVLLESPLESFLMEPGGKLLLLICL
jgi:hypothetical protein